MKKLAFILIIVALFLAGCTTTYRPDVQPQENNQEQTQQNELNATQNQAIPTQLPEQQDAQQETQAQPQRTLQQRRDSPEIPSEAERATLPDCSEKQFTILPVDLSKITEIAPLGNLAPPGHTFPTEHSYLHFNPGGTSTELFTLSAPADVYITSISKATGFTQDPTDYTIYFALCKDVIGYYNHVKELSPALQAIEASGNCRQNPSHGDGGSTYQYCENPLNLVSAGAEMGKVGRLQGNFDFGLIDLSKTNNFTNPGRYGIRSQHVQCPYEYYDEQNKQRFFALIQRNDEKQCGQVMQDVAGTAQGNWFYANARADSGSDWDKYLALVYENDAPNIQAVSIGGVFTDASVWPFTPQDSGKVNRNFAQVTVDGSVYCYESANQQGKIVIQLTSASELKIEKQTGSCTGSETLQSPTVYNR